MASSAPDSAPLGAGTPTSALLSWRPGGGRSFCAATGCAPLDGPIVHCGPAVGGGTGAGLSACGTDSAPGRSGADHGGRPLAESTVDCRPGSSPLRCASHSSSVSSRSPDAESPGAHRLIAFARSSDSRLSDSVEASRSGAVTRWEPPLPDDVPLRSTISSSPSDRSAVDFEDDRRSDEAAPDAKRGFSQADAVQPDERGSPVGWSSSAIVSPADSPDQPVCSGSRSGAALDDRPAPSALSASPVPESGQPGRSRCGLPPVDSPASGSKPRPDSGSLAEPPGDGQRSGRPESPVWTWR